MSDSLTAVRSIMEVMNLSVIGQAHVSKSLTIALLTNGNLLLEGLPGTAKTRSITMLSKVLQAKLGRVQFTPDLLPSDVTGTEIYSEVAGKQQLTFQPGPVFSNLLLADEINRAPAKVQSALLEAMEERQVTVAGKTHSLPELFMVMATQNPIEQEGTYPLPEAQMDRFAMKVNIDYPEDDAELSIIRLVRAEETPEPVNYKLVTQADIFAARKEIAGIHVSENIEKYIVSLVMATRHPERYQGSSLKSWINIGSSPRASITLDKCARAHAWLEGKDYVDPDDVRAVIHSVLRHRLILTYDAMADAILPDQVIDEIVRLVAVA